MAAAPRLATRGQRRVCMAQPARTGPAGSWGAAFSSVAARHVAVGVRGGRGGGMQKNNKMAAARLGRAGEGKASSAPLKPGASGRAGCGARGGWRGRGGGRGPLPRVRSRGVRSLALQQRALGLGTRTAFRPP